MTTIRTAVLEHVGKLDFRSVTGTGRLIDFGEAERGFLSPVESVLVALGACTGMDVISIAVKKRQAVDGYRVHVRGDQRSEYPQVFTDIDATGHISRVKLRLGMHFEYHGTIDTREFAERGPTPVLVVEWPNT